MNAGETENLVVPSYPKALAQDNSNVHQDNSVNKYGPQILIVGILAALGFGFGVASFVYASDRANGLEIQMQRSEMNKRQYEAEVLRKVNISENHWRNIEGHVEYMKGQLSRCTQ